MAFTGLGLAAEVVPVQAADMEMVEGPELSWKLSTWGKRRAFTEGMEYFSSELEKRTGGKFKIKIFYGEQLSKSKENLDGIKPAAFEAAHFCASYHPVVSAVRPDIPLNDVFRGMTPFFIADAVTVGLFLAFPDIVLWLPRLVGS